MRRQIIGFFSGLVFLVSPAISAGPGGKVFTDPTKAGEDYKIQGEYLGDVTTQDGNRTIGIQVIALGGGKFNVIGHVGGLPGDGWNRGDDRNEIEVQSEDGGFVFPVGDALVSFVEGQFSVEYDGQLLGVMKKVNRKSPTLGKKRLRERPFSLMVTGWTNLMTPSWWMVNGWEPPMCGPRKNWGTITCTWSLELPSCQRLVGRLAVTVVSMFKVVMKYRCWIHSALKARTTSVVGSIQSPSPM